MKKLLTISLLCASFCVNAQVYEWECVAMDGSRTGCKAATTENIPQAVGTFRDGVYVAPNGKEFAATSSAASVAAIVLQAQPKMARVKRVIGHSAQAMENAKHETMLSRWFVDLIMNKVSDLSGRKVDVGICNFGGIRIGMPEGDIMLDDILSMFPFRNELVYMELEGRRLRNVFEKMAASKFQAVGGVKVIVEDKTVTSILVGDHPLEDDKVYRVATISFLLNGGDGLFLADGASGLKIYDMYVKDAVLEHIAVLTATGKSVTGTEERCVTIR